MLLFNSNLCDIMFVKGSTSLRAMQLLIKTRDEKVLEINIIKSTKNILDDLSYEKSLLIMDLAILQK